jgi:FkbM family methyltransferase
MSFEAARDCYSSYLERLIPEPSPALQATVEDILSKHSLENPISSIDYNNLGVIALIEAESSSEAFERSSFLALAHDFFLTGYRIDSNPLCRIHIAMMCWLLGDTSNRVLMAFNTFIDSFHLSFSETQSSPPGIVYLSRGFGKHGEAIGIPSLLAESAYVQARILSCYFMLSATLSFYNETGLRILEILNKVLPGSSYCKLKLGVSLLVNDRMEGILHLHESHLLRPSAPEIYHALCLGYRSSGRVEAHSYWRKEAASRNAEGAAWQWALLPEDSRFTYLPFDGILLAAEASLQSYVTSVLLVDEDWFEPEIKFWRTFLQAGMVVIDVGANVGVYSFSAATRVGSMGKVIAVEPTALCIQCLHETIQINDLQQVSVYAVAASDTEGSLSFRTSVSSELNEVVANNVEEPGLITIPCLPLDTICEKENIQRVDIIKIDAEGHELSVLKGSSHLLANFQPVILYENVAGASGVNLPVYNFLQTQGYQLYRYRAFDDNLVKLSSVEELSGLLNIIAVPNGYWIKNQAG